MHPGISMDTVTVEYVFECYELNKNKFEFHSEKEL